MKTIKFIVCLLILTMGAMFLSACSKKQATPEVNVELVGGWDNDAGCSAIFAKNADVLTLVFFDDSHGNVFKDLALKYSKTGILSEFRAQDAHLSFYGNYSEGVMMISHYCRIPLYKVKN